MVRRRISVPPAAGLGARGSIVAIGDAEARLGLLGHQAFAAGLELVDGDGLDHVSLPGHQDVDTLQCFADALAEPCNLDVVSDIAVRRRLPRPDEGVVLPSESVDMLYSIRSGAHVPRSAARGTRSPAAM